MESFLADLNGKGIKVWADGGKLRYSGARDVLTPEMLDRIKQHKPQLIAFLSIPPRSNPSETAHASLDQRGLLIHETFSTGAQTYVVTACMECSGLVKTDVMRRSLEHLLVRHWILRSVYPWRENDLLMRTHRMPLDWKEGACGEGELEGEIEAASREGFDLEEGPLMRARWYQVREERGVLLLVFHHIICDEWSIRVLLEELSRLYATGGDPVQAGLERLEVDYADYAAWRNERIRSEVVRRSIGYWREQLRGVPGLLDLPLDRVRPEQGSHRGATVRFEIQEEVVRGLRAVARAEQATMFMVMLAAWKVLLFRYSHQEEIVVGTPVTLRSRPELERMVGYFLNMLPIRSKVRGEQPFTELLKAVKETVLQGLAHRDVPFGDMVQLSGVERSTRHTPLFQVSFVYVTESLNQLRIPGVEITSRELETGTAKFDLTIFMEEQGDRLHCGIEYASDLFDPERIQRMASHWLELVSQLTANPNETVSRLRIPTVEDSMTGKKSPAAVPAPSRPSGVADQKGRANGAAFTAAEQKILDVWKDVLGATSPSRSDDFFALGGTSLKALRLASALSRAIGKPVSPGVIFANPRLDSLLAALFKRKVGDPLIELFGSSVATPPSFCCVEYVLLRDVCQELGKSSNVLGIHIPPEEFSIYDHNQSRHQLNLEQLATKYASFLKEHGCRNGICLVGSSFGGALAYETAVQLRTGFGITAQVVMLDTVLLGFGLRRDPVRRAINRAKTVFRNGLPGLLRAWGQLRRGRNGKVESRINGEVVTEIAEYNKIHALWNYSPAASHLRTLLVRASEQDWLHGEGFILSPDYGWSQFISRLEFADLKTTHEGIREGEGATEVSKLINEFAAVSSEANV